MQTTPHTKGLRKAMGALSLGFMMVAGCSTTPPATTPVQANTPTPQPIASPVPATPTTTSTMLADIEQQANTYLKTIGNPTPRVVMIDNDQINTITGPNANWIGQKLNIYLKQHDLTLIPKYKLPRGNAIESESDVLTAMGGNYGPRSNDPKRFMTTTDGVTFKPDACIVVPETTDLSSRSIIERWIGSAGPKYLVAAIDPGAYQMAKRSIWHEAWHCMDREFVQAYRRAPIDNGFEIALANHRSEMFADVAATLTMASQGNLNIIQETADIRAVSTRWIGPRSMADHASDGAPGYSPKTDSDYYAGVMYYTTPAHDAALAYINRVGLDALKKLTLGDIQRIATDLTHQSALNAEQFRTISDYLKQGDSYLAAQTQKAASGDAAAKRNVDLLTEFKNRTDAAKSRTLTETATPVPKSHDVIPPVMEDILLATSKQEKLEIYTAMEASVSSALRNGQSVRQGVLNQLETWRKELQTSTKRHPELEQKLYMAALMLSNGYLDPLLSPAAPKPVPKPSP